MLSTFATGGVEGEEGRTVRLTIAIDHGISFDKLANHHTCLTQTIVAFRRSHVPSQVSDPQAIHAPRPNLGEPVCQQ
jgi:hypothetical protein